MPIPKDILYLKESDIQQTLSVAEAVDLAERGIQADAAGNVVGNKFYMPVDDMASSNPSQDTSVGKSWLMLKPSVTFQAILKNIKFLQLPQS